MALVIMYKNPFTRPVHWYLDDPTRPLFADVQEVMEINADGHELAYIEARFKGTIPFPVLISRGGGMNPTRPSELIRPNFPKDLGLYPLMVRWYGDMAKFIVANL